MPDNSADAHVASTTCEPTATWPRWWRLVVIGVCALIICSCRAASYPHARPGMAAGQDPIEPESGAYPPGSDPAIASTLPPAAYTGAPDQGMAAGGSMEPGMPGAAGMNAPWAPPGISRPWPKDEYIADGGDRGPPAWVSKNWEIHGLAPEDTVAHFDTPDGRTLVEPSNRVEIYAPKFAAIRRVVYVDTYEQDESAKGLNLPTEALVREERRLASTVLQPVAALGQIGDKRLIVQQRNAPAIAAESQQLALEAANRQKAYEDFAIIRIGQFADAEKAMLAERFQAAIVWTRNEGAHVILNHQAANEVDGDRRVQATYAVTSHKSPRLRLVKVASTDTARPGDIVAFTLRYDNTGSELIGNVTIVDNLTTRLEYIDDTASSTRKARFLFQENDAGSLVLRWEILDPLPPGAGGVLRFKCRVR